MDFSKIFILILLIISCLSIGYSSYVSVAKSDTLRQGAKIRDWEHLTSAKGIFELGFFSISAGYSGPNNPENYHYLGIWYARVPNEPVWIANRDSPVPDSSGSLMIESDGKLKISYVGGMISVSNVVPTFPGKNVCATLLDSGNLVVREVHGNGSFGDLLWTSFDYPTNTLVPGMKLGVNLKTGHIWKLTSWLSDQVPSRGAFELGLDTNGTNQLVISRRGEVYSTSGVWKNGSFEKAPDLTSTEFELNFVFVSNENERYFSYYPKHNNTFAKWKLDLLGQIEQLYLTRSTEFYSWHWRYAAENCPYDAKNPGVVCLNEKPVSCRKTSDVFVQTRGYFLDGNISYVSEDSPNGSRLALSDCHSICWKNCSCAAYTSSFADETGCYLYTNAHNFIVDATGEQYIYRLIKEHKS